ncbi:MAG: DegV family protein [Anaerolineales bacterium]|jgi:DegV family protein with EDD domain|nr:MAG: DegV family protein [Anaerolineales bacterium]
MTIKTRPFAIVTDSTADVPIDTAESLNITVIPAVLTLDGETYVDGVDISRAEFYRRMPDLRTPPTTAVPSVLVFEETYQRLFESGVERILSIHLSSNLSGMVNTAEQAALNFDDRVKVFDSSQLSLGVGFQAIESAQSVMKGLDFDQVVSTARRVRERAYALALIDRLEFMRRSGRVNWLRANIGDFLQIKQLVEVKDGLVNALARTRTYTKAFEHLISIASTWKNIKRLAVLHSGAPERAKELTERVVNLCPNPLMIVDITTVIGVHVGPGCVGLAVLTQD